MGRILRDAGRGVWILLAVLTLAGQSALPVYADTTDTAGSGGTVIEEPETYVLDYFDRIAVNSVKGVLTIRSGDDFSISFSGSGEAIPSFSVRDEILVVSGRKSEDEQAGKSGDGSVVVLGEDEPAEAEAPPVLRSAEGEPSDPEEITSPEAEAPNADVSKDSDTPEDADASKDTGAPEDPDTTEEPDAPKDSDEALGIVITVPSGIGIDTLRVAMEKGDLNMTNITANAVTIQSGGGNLFMKDVSLGTVDVYADTGEISLTEFTFGSLNIGMAEGGVNVETEDSLDGCKMEIKTGDGEILFNGDSKGDQYVQPGNGKRYLTIQVGSGSINISE